MKILLRLEEICPDRPDRYGLTPALENNRPPSSDPKWPVLPALGTAGLWESGFLKLKLGLAYVTCRLSSDKI